MKGKERENSTFVYLSALKESRQREQGAGRLLQGRGADGGNGAKGVLPCGIGLVCLMGKGGGGAQHYKD